MTSGRFPVPFRLALLAVATLLLSADGGAVAQDKAPAKAAAPPPVAAEPGSTTASFGDWVLRCQNDQCDAKRPRICEIAQAVVLQGAPAPIAQIAIGRSQASEPFHITAVLPIAISFPSQVRISTAPDDRSPLALDWRRCLPAGCIADAALADAALKRLRAATDLGRIGFRDASGADVSLPFSFRGLPQALDALAKEK